MQRTYRAVLASGSQGAVVSPTGEKPTLRDVGLKHRAAGLMLRLMHEVANRVQRHSELDRQEEMQSARTSMSPYEEMGKG